MCKRYPATGRGHARAEGVTPRQSCSVALAADRLPLGHEDTVELEWDAMVAGKVAEAAPGRVDLSG